MSETFSIIAIMLVLKLINDTRTLIFGDGVFDLKGVTQSGVTFKCYCQFTELAMSFNGFFNLV